MTEIGILSVGQTDPDVLNRIAENLRIVFTKSEVALIAEVMPISKKAFSTVRHQYSSDILLEAIRRIAEKDSFARVLGVADIDLFVPRLNFVLGRSDCPGKAALISLFRLKPEFYGRPPNLEATVDRGTKEAVHEIGHTLGLGDCPNPFCVMYFSNSVFETDRKVSLFCNKCQLEAKDTTVEPDEQLD